MRWNLEMNLTQEKAESGRERLELQIKSKLNQHPEFSTTKDSKFPIVLKPVQGQISVTGMN